MTTCPYQIFVSASFHEPTGPCSSSLSLTWMVKFSLWQVRLVPRNWIHLGPSYMIQWSIRNTIKWYHDSNRSYISPLKTSEFYHSHRHVKCKEWLGGEFQTFSKSTTKRKRGRFRCNRYTTVLLNCESYITHPPEHSWGRTSGLQQAF